MSGFVQGLIGGMIVFLLAIQLIRPAKTNPPIVQTHTLEAAISVPPAVNAILARSCNDCHSDRTDWPWYSSVAPISFLVINHVNEGRRSLNFSEWIPGGVGDAATFSFQRLHSVCKEVQAKKMPLSSYVLVHRQATLSQQDVQILCDWSENRLPQN